jgi:MHS family proline/betaine transporter-like MFS transporter
MVIQSQNQKTIFHIVVACSLGTILEWYDFSLYAYLVSVLSKVFFPNNDYLTSIMMAYSVFTIGFVVRPLGAILFGHLGDRVGRKKTLMISIILMASTTCLIGLLPTYNQVGLLAPILLISLRVVQGLAIGGEAIGAGSFVIESIGSEKRGLLTSLVWASSGIGILLSAVVVSTTTNILTNDELHVWGWRIPFLLGALTGFLGYYLNGSNK